MHSDIAIAGGFQERHRSAYRLFKLCFHVAASRLPIGECVHNTSVTLLVSLFDAADFAWDRAIGKIRPDPDTAATLHLMNVVDAGAHVARFPMLLPVDIVDTLDDTELYSTP
jgi:hypothetical protein